MKNVRKMTFIATIAALGSIGLGAMDKTWGNITDAKDALVAVLTDCKDSEMPYQLLEKLLLIHSPDTLEILLKDYSCVNPRFLFVQDNKNDETILHRAVAWHNQVMVKLLFNVAGQSVVELVGMKNKCGNTVLHLAVSANDEAIVGLLLDAVGSKDLVLAKNLRGLRALDFAQHNGNTAMRLRLGRYIF